MTFEEQAKNILHKQNIENVEAFLKEFDVELVKEIAYFSRDLRYLPSNDPTLKNSEKALRSLNKIVDAPIFRPYTIELVKAIRAIEVMLDWNKLQKPKGRITTITVGDAIQLGRLKANFENHFPGLSSHYREGTILNKLGKILIGKSIPNGTDKQINAYWTNILGQKN